jgi:hypothetical protein
MDDRRRFADAVSLGHIDHISITIPSELDSGEWVLPPKIHAADAGQCLGISIASQAMASSATGRCDLNRAPVLPGGPSHIKGVGWRNIPPGVWAAPNGSINPVGISPSRTP